MIKDRLDDMLLDLAIEINDAILKGEFKVLERSKYTIEIECCGETVEIWNDNNPESTECYGMEYRGDPLHFPDHKFVMPSTCRRLLREESQVDKDKRLKAIDEQIEALQKQKEV
jgi:hypothetical protein